MQKIDGNYIFNEHSSISNYFEQKNFYKLIINLLNEGYSYEKISELSEIPIDVIIDFKNYFEKTNSKI